jgi:hypothetical protein
MSLAKTLTSRGLVETAARRLKRTPQPLQKRPKSAQNLDEFRKW